jgi:exopolysaccharide biosynthesis WecB/TagA/CpsF family protein
MSSLQRNNRDIVNRSGHLQRRIGSVSFDVTDQSGAIQKILDSVAARSCEIFAFCNMHTFNLARRIPKLAAALERATVFNDGVGIDFGSLILFGTKFPSNLNGTDLIPLLLQSLSSPTRLFLLGGQPGVAEQAGKVLSAKFRHISVVGCHHGFFSPKDTPVVADQIRGVGADLVLVGMGNPHQELWAANAATRTGAVILCVGAYLDFASGRISRAPRSIRAMRCEWVYRMMREPTRLSSRYVGGVVPFFGAIIAEKFRPRAHLPSVDVAAQGDEYRTAL